MNWLFIHQNFPGQFVHAARHLAAGGDQVVFITQQRERELPGVRKIVYTLRRQPRAHRLLREYEAAIENALAVAAVCEALKRSGFTPDLVVGHSGWGETLFIKDCWPEVPLLGYFEWFYRATNSDLDFDREFPPDVNDRLRIRSRNAVNFVALDAADWGQTPTEFQRDGYPPRYHDMISVIHEGVDTRVVHPEPSTRLWLADGRNFGRNDRVITYSARNLEPYRGFHILMRALPQVLARHPDAHVLIVGGDGVSYGRRATAAASWRAQLLGELGDRLDVSRVHFLGRLNYRQYLAVLQLSSVHAYLTYPFVLSWSLIEAMAAGCAIVASRTAPVEEIVKDGENGYLVDCFDVEGLAEHLGDALEYPDRHQPIRAGARKTAVERFDLASICLPQYLDLLHTLARGGTPARRRRRKASRQPVVSG